MKVAARWLSQLRLKCSQTKAEMVWSAVNKHIVSHELYRPCQILGCTNSPRCYLSVPPVNDTSWVLFVSIQYNDRPPLSKITGKTSEKRFHTPVAARMRDLHMPIWYGMGKSHYSLYLTSFPKFNLGNSTQLFFSVHHLQWSRFLRSAYLQINYIVSHAHKFSRQIVPALGNTSAPGTYRMFSLSKLRISFMVYL